MESDPTGSYYIAGLVISFFFSGFFSIVKTVFVMVERNAATSDDEHIRYYATKINHILKNRLLFSGTVAFGKTISNIAFTVTLFIYLLLLFPGMTGYQTWVLPFGTSSLILSLFAHYIPRAFALRFYRPYITPCYYLYKASAWFLSPFASTFTLIYQLILRIFNYDEKLSFLSEEEKARITEAQNGESLDDQEKEMIRSIFDLGETTVDEIMVPRIDIKGLEIQSDLRTALKLINEEGHSRIPVYKETIDTVVGILYTKDILSWLAENPENSWDLPSLIKKPHFVPMGKKINELMSEFKRRHIHIAVIVDEYGGTAGLVTMEDILEEIVGDIQDEYDEEEKEITQINQNQFLVDPHIDIQDLNEELGTKLDEENVEYNTLGGLIYHEHGDVPQENTTFEFNGLRITVIKMDNQRIEKVKLEIIQKPDSGSSEVF